MRIRVASIDSFGLLEKSFLVNRSRSKMLKMDLMPGVLGFGGASATVVEFEFLVLVGTQLFFIGQGLV